MAQVRKACCWTGVPLAALLLVVGVLVMPREAGSDASGCTRFNNSKPTWDACVQAPNQACYYCEYSYSGGGYSICYEFEAGGGFCTDFQS